MCADLIVTWSGGNVCGVQVLRLESTEPLLSEYGENHVSTDDQFPRLHPTLSFQHDSCWVETSSGGAASLL